MQKEKLEKLKKSLDNKFLNEEMKDKIRKEIASMEAESKKDTAPVVAKAPAKATPKAKETPKAKVEPKVEAPKKATPKKSIKAEPTKTLSLVERRNQNKKALTKSPNVKYDLKKDAVRKALPMGKRTSKVGNELHESFFIPFVICNR